MISRLALMLLVVLPVACDDKDAKKESPSSAKKTDEQPDKDAAKEPVALGALVMRGPGTIMRLEGPSANFGIKCGKDGPFSFKTDRDIGVTLPDPIEVTVEGPPGAKVGVDDVTFQLDDKGRGTAKIDPAKWFAAMTYTIVQKGSSKPGSFIHEEVEWRAKVTVTVTPPGDGAETLSQECEVDPGGYFSAKYYGLEDGKGVEWPWEKGTPVPTEREGGWIETIKTKSAVGKVEHPGDVDVVVIVTKDKERKKKCGPYVGGGKKVFKDVVLNDSAATVYERRTGKVLGKKVFKAKPYACPDTTWSNEGLPDSYAKIKDTVADYEAMVKPHLGPAK